MDNVVPVIVRSPDFGYILKVSLFASLLLFCSFLPLTSYVSSVFTCMHGLKDLSAFENTQTQQIYMEMVAYH